MLPNISIIAVIVIVLVNIILFVVNQWRWLAIGWALQIFAIFWLTTLSWSVPQSAVKLISGWIAIAIVSAAKPEGILEIDEDEISSSFGFRFLSVGMTWLLAFSLSQPLQNLLSVRSEIIWGGLLLISAGMLQIGFSRNIVRTILGLLTFIGGFEVIYASIERSILVAGMLAIINIGLAWLATYFLNSLGDKNK